MKNKNKQDLIDSLNASLNDDSGQNKNDSSPFSVPDGYFNEFKNKLPDKIASPEKTFLFQIIFSKRILISLTILLLLTGSIWFYKSNNAGISHKPQFTEEEIETSSFSDELDESALVNFICDHTTAESSDNSLEQYLIENNIQSSEIENSL